MTAPDRPIRSSNDAASRGYTVIGFAAACQVGDPQYLEKISASGRGLVGFRPYGASKFCFPRTRSHAISGCWARSRSSRRRRTGDRTEDAIPKCRSGGATLGRLQSCPPKYGAPRSRSVWCSLLVRAGKEAAAGVAFANGWQQRIGIRNFTRFNACLGRRNAKAVQHGAAGRVLCGDDR